MLPLLKSDFEVGWHDIRKEDYVGYSSGYSFKGHCAVGTTNGAGPHNVQIFVLSADGVVMHALPGFWSPRDLARQLRFAQALHRLWMDEDRTLAQKRDMFRRMQTAEPRLHSAATFALSSWQGFDVRAERQRQGARDTVLDAEAPAKLPANLRGLLAKATTMNLQPGRPMMKPLNVLVHERMAVRPFVPFADFDIEEFVDYGRMFYDLNSRHDRGRSFAGQKTLMRKRAIAARRAAREQQRRGE